jgi:hypothetical protein
LVLPHDFWWVVLLDSRARLERIALSIFVFSIRTVGRRKLLLRAVDSAVAVEARRGCLRLVWDMRFLAKIGCEK